MGVARLDTGWLGPSIPVPHPSLIGNLEAAPLENGEIEARTAFFGERRACEMNTRYHCDASRFRAPGRG